ncbi:MAG: hypothetical protein ACON4T_02245 [Synechococcus sp.]
MALAELLDLAALIDNVPVLGRLDGLSRDLFRRQLVQMAVQGDTLTLSWRQDEEQYWRRADLPADLCQAGLPMQRQALGDFCADLLLDCGLTPSAVDLELLLPLESCQWRRLAGSGPGDDLRGLDVAMVRQQGLSLGWPFGLDDAYLAFTKTGKAEPASMLVGTQRLMLQAWVAVVEAADISLHRVDWLMAAAWRGLRAAFDHVPEEVVWLIRAKRGWRVLLMDEGYPELDRWLSDEELDPSLSRADAFRDGLEAMLAAWEERPGYAGDQSRWARHWWITAHAEDHEQWLGWLAATVEGPVLGRSPLQGGTVDPQADPLMTLALAGGQGLDLLEDYRPELGLPAPTPVLHAGNQSLTQGAIVGGGVLAVAGICLVGLGLHEGFQTQQLKAFEPVEQQMRATKLQLNKLSARLSSLKTDNQVIANQLVAVSSGSALLEQLVQNTPMGIQIKDLAVQGNVIDLEGLVATTSSTPGPLERINAMALALKNLPGTQANSVKVVRVADKNEFKLTWTLDPAATPSLEQLRALGAEGMMKRLQLLQREGVEL